ncbi:MAG: TetR/AcrR family transcriptional regulator [Pseudomonadales bacterium]|nr:TetR/AcrR family transcriptional regulator [Pseudomonadales bacterium]
MRASDWAGSPPANQQEAQEILLQGAMVCAREFGITKINIKRVAEQVGVTRQTVYRYFSSSDAMIAAVSWRVVNDTVGKLEQHVKARKGFENKVIESVLFLSEEIPNNEFLRQYFSANALQIHSMEELFNPMTLQFCVDYLRSLVAGKQSTVEQEQWLFDLAEHLLRTVLLLIVAPSERTATPDKKRKYLQNWLRPLLIRE